MAVLTTTAEGTIREANPGAAQLLGAPLHYLAGKPLEGDAADARAFDHVLATAETRPMLVPLTIRPRRRDPVGIHALVRRSAGRSDRSEVLWVLWDPEAEAGPSPATVQAIVGSGERRARTELLTNAAHELQTPITAILSALDVLQSGAKDIPEDRDRFLGHVHWEALRLGRLVWAMLALERAKGGEPLVRDTVRLAPLLDDIAVSLLPAPGVVVAVECAPDVAAWADRNLLEQVIANLALNSARYTESGTIVLSGQAVPPAQVRIEVRDTGIGISSEDADRVFAPFVRAAAHPAEGFGLGLAIVREAVEALGGVVTLEPDDPGGSVATVVLPGRAVPL